MSPPTWPRGTYTCCGRSIRARPPTTRCISRARPITGRRSRSLYGSHLGTSEEQFADATVGPDGTLYVTYRTIAHQKSTADAIWLVRSTDGGESFSAPQLVAGIMPFDSTQFSGNGADTCGDGPFACPSGLTFARFSSLSAVAADATGVHVVYSAETAGGQAKIFVRNSPDGLSWPSDPTTLDAAPTGHQFFPDVTSAGGTISVVFQDSRTDPAYSPGLPPGNTAAGVNSGNVVHAILARSTNGVSWTEQQLSTAGSNPNWEVRSSARSPFFGDYNYVSAVGSTVRSVWIGLARPRAGERSARNGRRR